MIISACNIILSRKLYEGSADFGILKVRSHEIKSMANTGRMRKRIQP